MAPLDRRRALHALLCAGTALPFPAHAQLDKLLSGLPSLTRSASTPADPESADVVRTYIDGDREVLRANGDMAEALGLKDAAARSRATADALGDGATVDGLKEADKVVTDSGGLIRAEMAKSPKLEDASKRRFASGMVKLAKGLRKYHGLAKSVSSPTAAGSALDMIRGGSVSSLAYIGTKLPSSVTNLSSALQNAVAFARSNDIPVPPDATQALAGL